ncbi:nickel ABC transporter permease [Sporolactobacillus terrae]|uniref:Glutathione transport system permease protein GsiC n=1 Tax=Sporolactobacillus terrae TaxID=269673 RepID=A0ABX5Q4T8_9BACL|nr:nickel ABC transporter permease [Sporolactobacillus terrae]QAA21662.1 glutathione ABC transporter permease GsiC [Sporolactobacillus terrae]QAA24634.1 glutathione ABC transporter permease GsiC [Sporolactobacillus terrae]UAK16470.1 ABC transporter permease subunit [Sporolactobacillus terrae]
MSRYIVRRIVQLIPILIMISLFVFLFVHLIPGDPARLIAGQDATAKDVAVVRQKLGLDKPLAVQYVIYMGQLFQGDLGLSLKTQQPVIQLISERFMPTFWLSLFSLLWALAAGLVVGVISATKRNKWQDYLGMVFAVSGLSLPSFWLGLMLIQLFAVVLGLVPTGGLDSWTSYILPSFTLGTGIAAVIARFTRSALMDVLKEDYIRTGKAKGLPRSRIVWGHALRNAMIPVVTMTGMQFGFLLGGSVVVETVFSWPGLGRLLIDSISYRDYTVIQAEILLFSLEFLLINLIVDIIYGFLNPQIRYD